MAMPNVFVPSLKRNLDLANSARDMEGWPYPWEQMPPDGREFSARNHTPVTVSDYGIANQVVVCEYDIPQGQCAVIKQVMQFFGGSGWIEGSGAVIWDLDVNRPLGASPIIGRPIADYAHGIYSLGSPTQGPWKVPGGIIVESGTIRLKVYTVGTVSTPVGNGDPNFYCGAFAGWIYPSS